MLCQLSLTTGKSDTKNLRRIVLPYHQLTYTMSQEEDDQHTPDYPMYEESEMQASSVDKETWDDYKNSGRDDFAVFVQQWYSGQLHDDNGAYVGLSREEV